jgi:hypothetical protein
MNTYLQVLKRFGATTIASDCDARDSALMLELVTGSADLGARATLCPITLATIGLEWPHVREIAAELGAERIARDVAAFRASMMRQRVLAAFTAAAPADVEHVTMGYDARFHAVQASGTGLPGSIEEC